MRRFVFIILSCVLMVGCVRQQLARPSDTQSGSKVSVSPVIQPGEVAVIDSNIIVTQPLSNARIASPLSIAGRSGVTTGEILFRLRDDTGAVLADGKLDAALIGGAWDNFSGSLEFAKPLTPVGTLEVFSLASESTEERNLIRLPVQFSEYEPQGAQVFFGSSIQDPEGLYCERAYPVVRALAYERGADMTTLLVRELLAGPTPAEKEAGFFTSIPAEGVAVQGIFLNEGTLQIDFNAALEAGVAGSCRVLHIRAQIEQTFLQFENVNEVVVSIDGRIDDILQP